jgi:dTMP kinase
MLISFEGLPGSGKTTQSRLLAKRLASEDVPVTYLPDLAAPAPGCLGALYEMFASSGDPFRRHGDVFTDTYLAAAIRADIVATRIEPALLQRHVVIEDRGAHTMCSYSLATILRHHEWDTSAAVAWLTTVGVIAGRGPDAVIRLRLPVPDCADRAARRGTPAWNAEQLSFLGHVEQAYQELEARDPRICRIDAQGLSGAAVHELVAAALAGHPLLPGPGRPDQATRHDTWA